VGAERAFLEALGGGCNMPLGAHAIARGARLRLVAFVADEGGLRRGEREGEDGEALGRALAEALRERGAAASPTR
jgi:hydroxymethylbilane synthase